MNRDRVLLRIFVLVLLSALFSVKAGAQSPKGASDEEFGPIVRAYLSYLKDEQEVVDDRVSRREITPAYYRRNSNRIRALRQVAIRIARESQNDYLPELEAAARDEMRNLFEQPPDASALKVGEVINNTYRYMGTIRSGELFYIFARLDPYEQSEQMEKEKKAKEQENKEPQPVSSTPALSTGASDGTRPRRAAGTP